VGQASAQVYCAAARDAGVLAGGDDLQFDEHLASWVSRKLSIGASK